MFSVKKIILLSPHAVLLSSRSSSFQKKKKILIHLCVDAYVMHYVTVECQLWPGVTDAMAFFGATLQWRHNGHDSVSNHQAHACLLHRLFRCTSNKTSKPRVTGLCAVNSPGTGEVPAQMASNAGNVFIWWRHHDVHWNLEMTGTTSINNQGRSNQSTLTVRSPGYYRKIRSIS